MAIHNDKFDFLRHNGANGLINSNNY